MYKKLPRHESEAAVMQEEGLVLNMAPGWAAWGCGDPCANRPLLPLQVHFIPGLAQQHPQKLSGQDMRRRLGFAADGGSADKDDGWVQEQGSHAKGHWLEGAEASTVSHHLVCSPWIVIRDNMRRASHTEARRHPKAFNGRHADIITAQLLAEVEVIGPPFQLILWWATPVHRFR
jgi:hypothetical protein